MNTFENVTQQGTPWAAEHRTCDVSKVENGFTVRGSFLVTTVDYNDKRKQEWKSRTFCFYTDVEVLEWVKGYLNATKEALGYEDVS